MTWTARAMAFAAATTRAATFTAAFTIATMRRHQFITGEFAISVLIQRLQSSNRIGEFISINHAVLIDIQCSDERRRRMMPATATALAIRTLALGVVSLHGERAKTDDGSSD